MREPGRTAAAGYQIGARRTFPCAPAAAWGALLSPEGLACWLGGPLDPARPAYRLPDGTTGEVRVWQPGSHLRLTWQPPGWARPSTVQVRVIPARSGTTIAFHQEHLAGPDEREAMRARWADALDHLGARLGGASA